MAELDLNYLGGIPIIGEGLDFLDAKLDVINEKCHLKHAPSDIEIEIPQAVDYLCQSFGYNKEKTITEVLRIPICEECIKGLYDPDWALLYCVTCNSSQWIYKPDSSFTFHTEVVWLDECPHCTDLS